MSSNQWQLMTNNNFLTTNLRSENNTKTVYDKSIIKLKASLDILYPSRSVSHAENKLLIKEWMEELKHWPLEYITEAYQRIRSQPNEKSYKTTLCQFIHHLHNVKPEDCGFISATKAYNLCYSHKFKHKLMQQWPNPAVASAYFDWINYSSSHINENVFFKERYVSMVKEYLMGKKTENIPPPQSYLPLKPKKTKEVGESSLNRLRSLMAS